MNMTKKLALAAVSAFVLGVTASAFAADMDTHDEKNRDGKRSR